MIRNAPSPLPTDLQRLSLCALAWRRRLALDPEVLPPRPGWPILRRSPAGGVEDGTAAGPGAAGPDIAR